jgi:hypothetical protein
MSSLRILLAALFLCLSSQAGAQVYKCKDASGKIMISDRPCQGQYQGQNAQTRNEKVNARSKNGVIVGRTRITTPQPTPGRWICQ